MTTKYSGTSKKLRRSKRIPAKYNLLLTLQDDSGNEVVKEVVTTVEISRHGARIRGRSPLKMECRGVLLDLRSLRKAPFRVAWQQQAPADKAYIESGVEFISDSDFWGAVFPASKAIRPNQETASVNPLSPRELLQEALQESAFESPGHGQFLEQVWCGLVEQLEEGSLITRAELVAYLRKIGRL